MQDEEISKDYANYFLSGLVEELPKRVEDKDVTTTVYRAFDRVRNEDSCKDIYQ